MKLVYTPLFTNEIESMESSIRPLFKLLENAGTCECLKKFCMFMIPCKVLNYHLLFFAVTVHVIITTLQGLQRVDHDLLSLRPLSMTYMRQSYNVSPATVGTIYFTSSQVFP